MSHPKIQLITASWCGACHAILPTVKSYAAQEGLIFEEVDADTHPDVAENIVQLPLLRILVDDREMGRVSGTFPISQLKELVASSRLPL
jgi:thioredoxin-like negative regulator of GroEL